MHNLSKYNLFYCMSITERILQFIKCCPPSTPKKMSETKAKKNLEGLLPIRRENLSPGHSGGS